MLFSGAAVASSGSLIETKTLLNTSGSATATNAFPQLFNILCKKGDFPTGTYPVLKTAGGTTVSYTYMDNLKSTWSDGSLKALPALARFPDAISGSSSASLKVYNGGSSQSASAITLSDLYAENFSVVGTGGIDNISGDWTADIQAASIVDTTVLGSGPAGIYWELLVDFKQSGSAHGQLLAYVYVLGLQNASGGIAGWRIMSESTQPWYNYDTPSKAYRSFTSLVLKANGTTINDPMGVYSAKTFTWSGSGATINCTAHGYTNGVAGRLTTTGTLPSGLSLNTTYWVSPYDGSSTLANTFYFQNASSWDATTITPTTSGSGTHTFTPIPYVNQFCLYTTATTSARYVYYQGAGTVSTESTILVQADTTYDHSTKILPPWNISTTPVGWGPYTWGAYQYGPVGIGINNGGDGPGGIGILPSWCSAHFARQGLQDETVVRIAGLTAGMWPYRFMDRTTRQNVNLSNSLSYTGMPSSIMSSVSWRAGGPGQGSWTSPAGAPNQSTVAFPGVNTSHLPDLASYAYAITGEAQYYRRLKDGANMAILCEPTGSGSRTFTVGVTTYGPILPAGDKTGREGSWGMRYIVAAAGFAADSDVFSPYVKAIAALQWTYEVAWFNSRNSWSTNAGFWYTQNNSAKKASWQDSYENYVRCLAAGLCEDTNAMTMVDKAATWVTYIRAQTGGVFMLTTYHETSGNTIDRGGGTELTTFSEWGSSPQTVGDMSWTSASNGITWTTPIFTPVNDTRIRFAETGSAPSGLSTMVDYYTVQTSGNFQKLSLTSGGAPVTITGNGTMSREATRVNLVSPPALGSVGLGISVSVGPSQQSGGMSWALALGCSVSGLTAAVDDLDANNTGLDWSVDIKNRMSRAF